jgi:hypothetical protein
MQYSWDPMSNSMMGIYLEAFKNCIYLHKLQWSTNDTRVPTLAIKHLIIIIASLVSGVGGGPSLTHLS